MKLTTHDINEAILMLDDDGERRMDKILASDPIEWLRQIKSIRDEDLAGRRGKVSTLVGEWYLSEIERIKRM